MAINNGWPNKIVDGYIACALWSESDDSGRLLDERFTAGDIPDGAAQAMRSECARFYDDNSADGFKFVVAVGAKFGRDGYVEFGHCFWLSRNGHGSGFFDRFMTSDGSAEEDAEVCERLQAAAAKTGERSMVICDDGSLYYYQG